LDVRLLPPGDFGDGFFARFLHIGMEVNMRNRIATGQTAQPTTAGTCSAKWRLLITITALALFSLTARAQNVTHVKVRDNGVQASFTSTDSTGCVVTDAILLVDMQTVKQMPDGSTTTVPFAALSLTTVDSCLGAQLDAFGITDTFTFQMDGISTASFQATIPMLLNNDASPGWANISASWDASGQVTVMTNHEVMRSPGLLTISALVGSFREAQATVTVSASFDDGVTMSLVGPSQAANLGTTTDGEITIIRPH
jgi:hypothetical protein